MAKTDRDSPTIMIVEDDRLLRDGLGVLLRGSGYRTVSFATGASALEAARSADQPAAAGAVVDVHLLDMNGLVLARRLREHLGPAAPIIVLSGDTSMEVLNSLPHVGATHFFAKPLCPDRLLDRLAELLPPRAAKADGDPDSGPLLRAT